MEVILMTRCGCSRKFKIPHPPNKYIDIPTDQNEPDRAFVNLVPNAPSSPRFSARRFKLKSHGGLRAYYFEEAGQ